GEHRVDEGVVYVALDQDSLGRAADLTGAQRRPVHRGPGRGPEVGVAQYDQRAVARAFHDRALEAGAGLDLGAGGRGADETYGVNPGVRDQGFAGRARAGQDVHQALGQPGVAQYV